ncbi:puromycin-sensitive aminopeptidase-like [Clytia hemisphaerica]|uniref:Aminopeptidase n=1 Tax=Clytia hemisphaerica TaxID=252671 RepID=A0A7M5VDA1_9CNID
MAKEFKRLSTSVRPSNYNVTFHPNLETFKFTGSETVDIEVRRDTKRIQVNSLDIVIDEAEFHSETISYKCAESDIVYDKETEIVIFNFPNTLPKGNATLKLKFTGELNDKMKGFYRSKYTTQGGEEKYMGVTQFEATDARRAFPCWDEPAIKATFDITMIAPKDLVVLSNMDVKEEKPFAEDETHKVVSFNKSPIMSTYLVAFVVGEFEYVEGRTTDDIAVKVYTPCGKTEQGKFALDISLKTLPFYADYFGIKYPLPKMDLIAIPDFAAGAMENWGLVTYRETCLLVDEKETSITAKQWVALVVGHEIAHQWFGNLTTMEWWTDLWLNEGFASWIEYLCVDFCCPDFHIWKQFVSTDYTKALELDALKNSHPIEVEVKNPAEIDEIFDAISYSKGASVIRMLHNWIGEKDFKSGLHSYLTTFSYKNGKTKDLWHHLQMKSGKPVSTVMNTWTSQMGYPVISVCDEHTKDGSRILTLDAKKFNSDGSQEGSDAKWDVPIWVATKSSKGESCYDTLVNGNDFPMNLHIQGCQQDDWIKLNPGQVGFYRINYSPEMLQRLIPSIQSLGSVDRLGLESDLFALAYSGYTTTNNFLDILNGYRSENDFVVWSNIDQNLSCLGILLQNTDHYENYKKFVLSFFKPLADKLGWEPQEGESPLTGMLRGKAIRRLGLCGDADVVAKCQQMFQAHVDGSESIPADLRDAVYCTVSRNGDEETFNNMVKLYNDTTHMEEQGRLVRVLGFNQDEAIIQKALDFCMSDKVRSGDTVFALAGCTGSLLGRRMTWRTVKDNWEELYGRYQGGFLLSRLIKISTENFVTQEEEDDVTNFFSGKEVPAAERVIRQSIESIQCNKRWLARDKDVIIDWLSKN